MRALDARRFAREFKKECGDRIEYAWKKWNRSIFVYRTALRAYRKMCSERKTGLHRKCVFTIEGETENLV